MHSNSRTTPGILFSGPPEPDILRNSFRNLFFRSNAIKDVRPPEPFIENINDSVGTQAQALYKNEAIYFLSNRTTPEEYNSI
jgi:hypothetical protein